MKKEKIALKPYLDTIASWCETMTATELKAVLMGLAKEVPVSERIDFLDQIKSYLPDKKSMKRKALGSVEKVLGEIAALKEDVEERIESIEDGSFWDDDDSWQYGDYDDEPEYVSEDQTDELTSLFATAGDLFLNDQLEDAQKVYEALFDLLDDIGEMNRPSMTETVDIREARARFCRCIYETTSEGERLQAFARAMAIERVSPYASNEYYVDEDYPLMQDVIDAKTDEMPHLNTFLIKWRKYLQKIGTHSRAAILLLETTYRLDGFAGVAKLARKWKNNQPRGYLYWLDLLKRESDHERIIEVGIEGLDALAYGIPREQAAQFLIDAAMAVDVPNKALYGMAERFYSSPNDQNLLEWMAFAVKQRARGKELEKAVAFLKSDDSTDSEKEGLYIKCLLMTGQLKDVLNKVAHKKSVGWSYNSHIGVVFGAILSLLTDHAETATCVKALFQRYANERSVYAHRITVDEGTNSSFYEEILTGVRQKKFTAPQRKEFFSWADKIGKNRINHIVSNKHRNAYERAAQVLGALSEVYVLTDSIEKATRLLDHFYNEKYNRFSAFRREVSAVTSRSALLRNLRF